MSAKFKLLIIGLVLVLQAETCKKDNFKNVPPCIIEKIAQFRKEGVANPPASVWQYEYKGQTVYYIAARCCDIPSSVYDRNCNLICSPDGGYTGKGDGKCADFAKTATKKRLIWEDDRK